MKKKEPSKRIEDKIFDALPIHELVEEEKRKQRAYGAAPRGARPFRKKFPLYLGVAVFLIGMILGWAAKEILSEKQETLALWNRFGLRTELARISFTVNPKPLGKGRPLPGRRIALKGGERISINYGKEELFYSKIAIKKSLGSLFSEEPKLFLDGKTPIELRKNIIAFIKPEEKTHFLLEVKVDPLSKPLGKIHIDLHLKPEDWIDRANALKGHPKSQRICYQNALKGAPKNKQFLIAYGEFLMGVGDYKEAEPIFLRALKVDQNDVEVLKGLVSIYSTQKPKIALTLYEKLLQLDSSHRLTYYRKIALVQERLGLDQTKTFKKILEINSQDKGALKGLERKYQDLIQEAKKAEQKGRLSEAIDLVRKAGKTRSKDTNTQYLATLLNNFAFVHAEKKSYGKAISFYKESIRLNPHPTTYLNMAVVYDRRGNEKLAIQTLEKAYALKPKDARTLRDILVFWARLLERKKSYKKAMNLYMESIKAYPKDAEALMGLGMLHFNKKAYDKALNYLTKAAELSAGEKNPENLEIYKLIGELYRRKGRLSKVNKKKVELYTLALNAYDQALSLKKDDKEAKKRWNELAQERMALKIKMMKRTP